MRVHRPTVVLFPLLFVAVAYAQKAPDNAKPPVIETTVCKVLGDPSAYNNKLVKLRGYVDIGFEWAVLLDEHCPDRAIWFAPADGSGPPGLAITVRGNGSPGSKDSRGQTVPPIPVQFVRDSNADELNHYLAISATCKDQLTAIDPTDCTIYRVTATFTGRIDGVSNEVHAAHQKWSTRDPNFGKGFGHMGMYDAQLVVQSVEKVIAEDPSDIRKRQASSP